MLQGRRLRRKKNAWEGGAFLSLPHIFQRLAASTPHCAVPYEEFGQT
jgi:hypothetical protein